MQIDSPLFDLDIIGTENTSVLKLNNTQMVCKGTREYCLSTREEILSNRGFTLPENWDLKWNFHTKSTWTPSQIGGTKLGCHLTPASYSLSTDESNPEDVTEWDDVTVNDIKFLPLSATTAPHEANEITTNSASFKGVQFDRTNDILKADDLADAGVFGSGTDRFLFYFFIKHTDTVTSGERYIFSSDTTRDWALAIDPTDIGGGTTNRAFHVYKNGSILLDTGMAHMAWSTGAYQIIGCGWQGQYEILKLNGGGNLGDESTISSINVAPAQDMFLGARQNALGGRLSGTQWGGTIYEMIYVRDHDAADTPTICEKIEGYLAHKYGQASLLPNTHTYKDHPPRGVT